VREKKLENFSKVRIYKNLKKDQSVNLVLSDTMNRVFGILVNPKGKLTERQKIKAAISKKKKSSLKKVVAKIKKKAQKKVEKESPKKVQKKLKKVKKELKKKALHPPKTKSGKKK
jgi:hypothetical protein